MLTIKQLATNKKEKWTENIITQKIISLSWWHNQAPNINFDYKIYIFIYFGILFLLMSVPVKTQNNLCFYDAYTLNGVILKWLIYKQILCNEIWYCLVYTQTLKQSIHLCIYISPKSCLSLFWREREWIMKII